MPAMWGAAAMGGLSLAGGFMSSRRSRREMKRMRRHMEDRLEFAKEQWNHFRDTYGDIEQQMVHDAMHGAQADIAGVTERARADVEGAFDRQRDSRERELQSMGLDPSSGRYDSSMREMGINQAATSAMAQNQARTRERTRAAQETRDRRMNVGQFGSEMTNQAGQQVQQAHSALGNVHGQAAQQANQLAGNLFAGAGQMGGLALQQGMGGGDTTPDTTGGGGSSPDFNYSAGGLDFNAPANQPQFNHSAGAGSGYSAGRGLDFNEYSMRG